MPPGPPHSDRRLCILAKLDSTPLPAVQTFPQRTCVYYGSPDVCMHT